MSIVYNFIMDPHLAQLIRRLSAVDSMINSTGVHSTPIDENNIWGLQSGGFYVHSSSDSDGEPIIFMFKSSYPTKISMTQSVYNELLHDNDKRVVEGLKPMIIYLELCRDANGVRLEHMSETVSTYLTMHDIFERGAGIMTVFKYNESVTSPPGILLSAGASSVAVGIPPFFVLDQGVSVDTAKQAIGISDRTICNCLSKVFDSSNPIEFSVKSGQENPNNSIMSPDTFGRMGCIFTFKSYSFNEHGHQTSITNNTVLVIGYRSSDKGYALVYVKSGDDAPVIFTTTSFSLSVKNLSDPGSLISDLHSGRTFNFYDNFDIGVRRFLKLLCDFSYRSYSTVCKVVLTELGVQLKVPCYITKDVQSSVGHDQVIYSSNIAELNGKNIVIPMGFVSSSSTSAAATINTLDKASAARAIPLTNSINTTPKYTDIAAEAYGDGFVVSAIYLERINPAESRPVDPKSVLISGLRDILQQMSNKLYKLSTTDDIFQLLIVEIKKLHTVAYTGRLSSRSSVQSDPSIIVKESAQNALDILIRATQSMNDSLPIVSDITNRLSNNMHNNISHIQHISKLPFESQRQTKIFDHMIGIIGLIRNKLWLEFDPVYNKWVKGMNDLQQFISISEDSSEDDIRTAILKLTSGSSTGKRKRRDSGGSNSHKTKKKLPRVRKTRKNTKRPKYIKKHATRRRR